MSLSSPDTKVSYYHSVHRDSDPAVHPSRPGPEQQEPGTRAVGLRPKDFLVFLHFLHIFSRLWTFFFTIFHPISNFVLFIQSI